MRPFFLLILLLLTGCISIDFFSYDSHSYLKEAEQYSRQQKYDEAISAYRKHMEERLLITERPEWENPYFYLILIGDIQLGQNKPEEALESYEDAEQRQVDQYLISDRIRSLASWYEKNDQLDEAVKVLLKHRDKDSFMFDSMLDRISKEIVKREEIGN